MLPGAAPKVFVLGVASEHWFDLVQAQLPGADLRSDLGERDFGLFVLTPGTDVSAIPWIETLCIGGCARADMPAIRSVVRVRNFAVARKDIVVDLSVFLSPGAAEGEAQIDNDGLACLVEVIAAEFGSLRGGSGGLEPCHGAYLEGRRWSYSMAMEYTVGLAW